MAFADFSSVPTNATLSPRPFQAHVADDKLQHMKDLLKLSPVGPAVWENTSNNQGDTLLSDPSRRHGVRRDWLTNAKEHWLNVFDWRKTEDRINSYPNFQVDITGADNTPFSIHFIALFSKKKDAIPIAFYHGWPGSFLEFLKILDLLRERYTPETLPYHIIVPSLPGYTYSNGPPIDVDYNVQRASELLHRLMLGLGFDAYLSQGGDIGSIVARQQAARFDECISMHLNMTSLPATFDQSNLDGLNAVERQAVARGKEFQEIGWAYGIEHGTRTATIGLALSASPLALLSWIAEKFLEWSDKDPSLDEILESVSLYWLTDTFPRCIYPYRDLKRQPLPVPKPFGFSFFPKELRPTPKKWVEQTGNLQYFYEHTEGGHFAVSPFPSENDILPILADLLSPQALELPAVLLEDVQDWASRVWQTR